VFGPQPGPRNVARDLGIPRELVEPTRVYAMSAFMMSRHCRMPSRADDTCLQRSRQIGTCATEAFEDPNPRRRKDNTGLGVRCENFLKSRRPHEQRSSRAKLGAPVHQVGGVWMQDTVIVQKHNHRLLGFSLLRREAVQHWSHWCTYQPRHYRFTTSRCISSRAVCV